MRALGRIKDQAKRTQDFEDSFGLSVAQQDLVLADQHHA
jgi:hypothetical protein